MIFEEVVLHNFGAYQGQHKVNLAVSPERPIILVGALNGSGKTTLLDAMQLALYGKGARCSGRERLAYPDFLESMMNRDAPNGQQAGVEFAFRARTAGQDSQIRVHRTWEKRGATVRERLEIYRNDQLDQVASERWAEFVEDLMPLQIADLFFFDGEKIEGLADPQRSSSLLRVGIHSLLGLDLVESLVKSLQVLERKKKTAGASQVDRQKLDALEKERDEAQAVLKAVLQKRAAHQIVLDSAEMAENEANEHFKRVGGDLYGQRQQLEESESRLVAQQGVITTELLEIAGGGLSLVMSRGVVDEVLQQAKYSRVMRDSSLLREESAIRDAATLVFLESVVTNKKSLSRVEEYLAADRASRYSELGSTSLVSENVLDQFRSMNVTQGVDDAKRLLAAESDLLERLRVVRQNIAAMPSGDVVGDAQAAIQRCRAERARAEALASIQDEEIQESRKKIARLQQLIDGEASRLGGYLIDYEVSNRVVIHSARARTTLAKFQERLLQENLHHLEKTILDCFRVLARKNRLVSGISIDPTSFQLSVLQEGGRVVSAHRFSAGERQLLAVATLWALARASGRHLPAVIDTPLSRLDSKHRGTLVREYFPKASHQVILLSTDEEVVGRYYSMLKPFLAREYLIEHDETEKTSRIIAGYFGDQAHREAA